MKADDDELLQSFPVDEELGQVGLPREMVASIRVHPSLAGAQLVTAVHVSVLLFVGARPTQTGAHCWGGGNVLDKVMWISMSFPVQFFPFDAYNGNMKRIVIKIYQNLPKFCTYLCNQLSRVSAQVVSSRNV